MHKQLYGNGQNTLLAIQSNRGSTPSGWGLVYASKKGDGSITW
jgi:hypothetical protein